MGVAKQRISVKSSHMDRFWDLSGCCACIPYTSRQQERGQGVPGGTGMGEVPSGHIDVWSSEGPQ